MLIQNINNNKKGNLVINKTKNNNTLVYYYASWCGYCQQFQDEWNKIKDKIIKQNNCDIIEIESDELKYAEKLKSHFKGFPTLILYTKKEFTKPKENNKKLANLFMNQEPDNIKLPLNAIKYDKERKLSEVMKFINLHLNNNTHNKGEKNKNNNSNNSNNNKNSHIFKFEIKKKPARTQYKPKSYTLKSSLKSKPKPRKINPIQIRQPRHTKQMSKIKIYKPKVKGKKKSLGIDYTKKEIDKMKKERKNNSSIISRLKKELSESFKI